MQVFKKENELIPCKYAKGFYVVPWYTRYSVNKEGEVFDRKFQLPARVYKLKSESGKNYYKLANRISVHKLIAKTFLDDSHIPEIDDRIVNHLDGNSENNNANNLEWTTYQGNAVHAYSTGLRSDNKPLLCKNLLTGEIERFYSYWDCARYFKINGGNIHHHLNSKAKNKIFMKHFLLIREGESWPEINKNFINEYRKGDMKSTVIIDKELNQLHIFKTITEASKFININLYTLMQRLRVMVSKNQDFIEEDKYVITLTKYISKVKKEDMEEIIHVREKHPNNFKKRKPVKIKVLDTKTGIEEEWESSEKFANSLNITKNTFQKHIHRTKGIFQNRYKVTYLS